MSATRFFHDVETAASTLVSLKSLKRICIENVHFDKDANTFEVTIKGGYVLRILFFDVSQYPSRADGALFFDAVNKSKCADSTKADKVSKAVSCFIERGPFSRILSNAFHAIAKVRLLPFWDSFFLAAKTFASTENSQDPEDNLEREAKDGQVLDKVDGIELNAARFEGAEKVVKDMDELKQFGYSPRVRRISSRLVELGASVNVSDLELVDEAKEVWGLRCGTRIEVCTIWKDKHIGPTSWSSQHSVKFKVQLLRDGGKRKEKAVTVPFHLGNSIQSVLNDAFYQVLKWIFAEGSNCGWAGALANVRELEQSNGKPDLRGQEVDQLERKLCSKALQIYESEREEERAARHNLALLAVRWVRREILTANKKCTQCRLLIPVGIYGGLKLRTCSRNICVFQGSELRLNDALLELELRYNPIVVDLLISLTCYAASDESDRGVLDPAPSPAIIDKDNSGDSLQDLLKLELDESRRLIRTEVPALTRSSTRSLVQALQTIPSVFDLYKAVLKGKKIRDYLEEVNVHPLAYRLLYWIVASNRAELRLLSPRQKRVQGPENLCSGTKKLHESWQFIVQSGTPEKEAKFAALQEQYSSGYAFHGASVQSWHSIMRNGLDFKERLHGRGGGDGVYLSKWMQYSAGYSNGAVDTLRQQNTCWTNSILKPTSCLAVVEYICVPPAKKNKTEHLVMEDPCTVMTRYLLLGCDNSPDNVRELLSLADKQDNQNFNTITEFCKMLPSNEAPEVPVSYALHQSISLGPRLTCYTILQMISEHDLILWASMECDRMHREGKGLEVVRSALKNLLNAMKGKKMETPSRQNSSQFKQTHAIQLNCPGCEASVPREALKLFMESLDPLLLDASAHTQRYSNFSFPGDISNLLDRLGPQADPLRGWSADESFYQTEEECMIPKPCGVEAVALSPSTKRLKSTQIEGPVDTTILIEDMSVEKAGTGLVKDLVRPRLKRRATRCTKAHLPRKRKRTRRSEDTYAENGAISNSTSDKLTDLPAHLIMRLIDMLLEREGPGFLVADQARSILSLGATCRGLRRLCSEALTSLYFRFNLACKEYFPGGPLPQKVLSPILKLAGRNLRQVEISCCETAKHIGSYARIGILCPNISELSISHNRSRAFFSSYKGLLEIIGPNLKVFKSVLSYGQWQLQDLKELVQLCPHLEKLVIQRTDSALEPAGLSLLCGAYGPQMVELGLGFRGISVANAIEMIEEKFPRLKFLHVGGPFVCEGDTMRNRMAFDTYAAYYKAWGTLETKFGIYKRWTDSCNEPDGSARSLTVISADLKISVAEDVEKICEEVGSHVVAVNLFGLKGVHDSLLEVLGRKSKKLRCASLGGHSLVTDNGLDAFCMGVGASLRYLSLSDRSYPQSDHCINITSSSLTSVITHCTGLNLLDVSGFYNISDSEVTMIAQGLGEKLKVLWLTANKKITSASARALAQYCPNAHIVISSSKRDQFWCDKEATAKLRVRNFRNFKHAHASDGSGECHMEHALTEKFSGLTPAGNLLCEAPPLSNMCDTRYYLPKGRRRRATSRKTSASASAHL